MLSTSQANRIKRLQQAGVSHRRIAHETGHSTQTVYVVLSGQWQGKSAASKPQEQRCPRCGGKFIGHCRPCRIRQYVAAQRASI